MNEQETISYDNWEIQRYGKGTPYPFLIFDNWYLPHEEKAVWSEIEFYMRNPLIQRPADDPYSASAYYDDKTSKAKNTRVFISELYKVTGASHINNCLYKQRSKIFHSILEENCLPYYRSFEASNADSTMLSFYRDDDHYDTHYDSPSWTCLIWMVKEPKHFDGGDFEFTDINHKIELKNNRMVIFPSCCNHRVYPLKYHDMNNKSIGKFTITHFYLHFPASVDYQHPNWEVDKS